MALTTTIPAFKRATVDELTALQIRTDASSATDYVQIAYGPPPDDQMRNEGIWFSNSCEIIEDPEHRLQAGRRTRYYLWGLTLEVHSRVTNLTENAEQRAFVIASAVEDFFAANPQPAEWSNNDETIPTGLIFAVVTGIRSELREESEGRQSVVIEIDINAQEVLK